MRNLLKIISGEKLSSRKIKKARNGKKIENIPEIIVTARWGFNNNAEPGQPLYGTIKCDTFSGNINNLYSEDGKIKRQIAKYEHYTIWGNNGPEYYGGVEATEKGYKLKYYEELTYNLDGFLEKNKEK